MKFSDKCFAIKTKTKKYGKEISWTLGKCSSAEKYTDHDTFSEECCLAPGEYTLSCVDSYGDGWNGGLVEILGKQYCGDGNYWDLKEEDINIRNTLQG